MDFSNFIKSYLQTVYLLEKEEGSWKGGIWVPGEDIETPFKAAITSFSDDLLAFGEGGTYTEDDNKLYTYKKLARGQKVKVAGELYTVTGERDYAFYSNGLRMYIIRKEGAAHD